MIYNKKHKKVEEMMNEVKGAEIIHTNKISLKLMDRSHFALQFLCLITRVLRVTTRAPLLRALLLKFITAWQNYNKEQNHCFVC